MDNSIMVVKEYGHIEIHLKTLMEQHHLNRTRLARMIGTRYEVIDKWYHGNVERIDADILARLCYVLGCETSDIVRYVAGKEAADKQEDTWIPAN